MKGQFIVLEGIDGCGKSTQMRYLENWLPQSGLMPKQAQLKKTREPGGTPLGNSLRELLLNPPGESSPEPTAEILLYAADRAQHISQVIQPTLHKGDWIICDRFVGSTYAYQGYGRNLDLDLIEKLEEIATRGLKPDMTFWLDLPVSESIKRRGERPEDRMESEGIEFLRKVASGFAKLAKNRQWIEIDAHQPAERVSKCIEREILGHFNSK